MNNSVRKKHPWLTPLQLSNGTVLPHRLMPGPMEGIMRPLFCMAANELNLIDYWITPFVSISYSVPKLTILKKRIDFFIKNEKPIIVQLIGSSASALAEAAKRLQDIGIESINLNFACPSRTVISSNSGGKLLEDTEQMLKIIESIKKECPEISLSAKLRTGYSSPEEISNFLPEIAKTSIDFIMLHFRTVIEWYKAVDYGPERIIKAVKMAYPTPIIASGDIFSYKDAEEMYNTTNCQGITVARGLFIDPYLIRRIEANLKNEPLNLSEDSRIIFFKKMTEIAREKPQYFVRSSFIELIKSFWGIKHPLFEKLKHMNSEELIKYF
jgi:tRNA-dihydrouridine synthase C